MKKLKYCYSHLKSFDFMFWIVLFMFLNHISIPHTPNPLFHPISFFTSRMHSLISLKSYTVSYITNLDNSVHPFHFPSSTSSSFSTLTTSLHLECCTAPFMLLFQQRNAHYHTSLLNSSNVLDSSFLFTLLLIHWRITFWIEQTFPAFFNLYSSS